MPDHTADGIFGLRCGGTIAPEKLGPIGYIKHPDAIRDETDIRIRPSRDTPAEAAPPPRELPACPSDFNRVKVLSARHNPLFRLMAYKSIEPLSGLSCSVFPAFPGLSDAALLIADGIDR
ncbi:hypothetical protein [Candidatus Methanocrinis natronophilus]|uniref:Uncharacterized protein n=1 Tax=Candidatus Methanocrinis natronophilus TaxID=3033396 RepID=A0ABT5X7Q7_9EURY|nr:hypothetical protein [Candidatus Methanocrinis natronophilus]MDF0590730.1 hypothetical protein [Candidatus Methanocrinis natronophilus]